jgi:hypothetical protein
MPQSFLRGSVIKAVLVAAIPSLAVLALAAPGSAGTVVPLGPFRSLALRSGGKVILRHGSDQRVTLLKGSTDYSSVRIVEGDRLVIERCRSRCPKGYELVVEVRTPDIDGIMVADGGSIRSSGSFPRQASLQAAVRDGGTIDLRSMTVESVAAAVQDGGRILAKPKKALVGSVARGGVITYWGSPTVTSSIQKGGVVARGAPGDVDKPLEEVSPATPALPQIPPLPSTGIRGTFETF